jgi:hypothetical protein
MHDSTEEGKMDDVRPISPPRLFWSHLESQRPSCMYYISLFLNTLPNTSRQYPNKTQAMTRSRLDNDLSPEQIRWISIACTLVVIPAAYLMYRHYLSLKARYPDAAEETSQVKADGKVKKSS